MSATPGQIASQDQEVAQARHEADMICAVYERCCASMPEDFAREIARLWWLKPEIMEHSCDDGDLV